MLKAIRPCAERVWLRQTTVAMHDSHTCIGTDYVVRYFNANSGW